MVRSPGSLAAPGRLKARWVLAQPQPLWASRLAAQLGISPVLAQCLINRGLTDPETGRHFLEPRLSRLRDPFLLPGMRAAVERLEQARACKQPLVIFGDYDVDGVSASALLSEVLQQLGWSCSVYLPHRLDEGYGLSVEAVQNCLKQHPARLLLAVDCGSTAYNTVQSLQAQGVDVIILDHHQLSDPAPPATALINPRLAAGADSCEAPGIELCSVGLAFKLAHALVKQARQQGRPEAQHLDLRHWLDLVALGTIADVVPLTGENRILVRTGLIRLNQTQRPGLHALREVARCARPLDPYSVGFQLAPRLNAAGRLETAHIALQLLQAPSDESAHLLAEQLDARNRERQSIEREILEEVYQRLQDGFDPANHYVIVEADPRWHLGVVGVVAARLVQEFHRPAVVLGGDQHCLRGSGRSIPGFDLAAGLRACSDLLLRHGGHALAAGLSVDPTRLPLLRARLNELARRWLPPEALQPALHIDAEVALAELTPSAVRELDRLKPAGPGNPPVHLLVRGLKSHRPLQRFGTAFQHVRLWVTDGRTVREAVWWSGGLQEQLPIGSFDLVVAPYWHTWDGHGAVRLRVLDWRPA
ncbi:MAG: single-stranded-DNA-specific exonuclease RecJ [Verrucomicrobiota bacterium]|nr:single-stranded-DNA-specific exonuclease RecJ [Limisphaera sp.]MDW8382266.1 single-stranded-DNA-specific exonuclease RecJ [Verrucomicrobiota bacterium]